MIFTVNPGSNPHQQIISYIIKKKRHDPDLNRESQRDRFSRPAQYQIMRSWQENTVFATEQDSQLG